MRTVPVIITLPSCMFFAFSNQFKCIYFTSCHWSAIRDNFLSAFLSLCLLFPGDCWVLKLLPSRMSKEFWLSFPYIVLTCAPLSLRSLFCFFFSGHPGVYMVRKELVKELEQLCVSMQHRMRWKQGSSFEVEGMRHKCCLLLLWRYYADLTLVDQPWK